MKRLAVYCGSSMGAKAHYEQCAHDLAIVMAQRGIDLVYGGGKLGLMGVVADTVLSQGGQAYGVIPEALRDHEVAHQGLTELYIVKDMHERKAKMTELTDAFVAIPGGIGTLDELFEAWTWRSLGYHNKPFALLDVDGYWHHLSQFLNNVAQQKFMSEERRNLLIEGDDIGDILDQLTMACDDKKSQMIW